MARVFRGETLPDKDMPQVSPATGTGNFGTLPVGIERPFDRPGNFVVETGPSASRIEFVFRAVELCSALFAEVGTLFVETVIFARKGPFRSLVDNDPFLFGCKFFFLHIVLCIDRAGRHEQHSRQNHPAPTVGCG